jgi:hypothetical protein
MGKTLVQPDNMTWAEWMCELMCGEPEDDEDDRTVEHTGQSKDTDRVQ